MRTIAIKSLIKNAETMIAKIGSLAENGVKRPVNNSVRPNLFFLILTVFRYALYQSMD